MVEPAGAAGPATRPGEPAEEPDPRTRRERLAADLHLLRRVGKLLAPHLLRLAGLAGSVVVQATASAVTPFLVREMLDVALPRRDLGLLLLLAGATFAAAAFGALAGVGSTALSHSTGHRVLHGLRTDMFGHLQRMPLTFYGRTRTTELTSRVVSDVDGVSGVLTGTASSAVQNGVLLLATGTALMLLDWRLASIALVGALVLLTVTGRLGREKRRLTTRRQRGLAHLGGLIEESLSVSAVVLVRSLGRDRDQQERFSAESAQLADVQLRQALTGRWRLALRGAALVALPAVVYTVAGIELAAGAAISIGTVVAFATTLTRLVRPVTALQNAGQGFTGSLALFERIFAVLDLPTAPAAGPGAPPLAVRRGDVEVRGVNVRYEGSSRPALVDVDLTVPAGTTTALVGATGAGKSTLAHVILGLLRPDAGRVLVDGQDLAVAHADSVAAAIGFVAQDTYLFHASVRDNLLFAKPDATEAELVAACRAAHVHEVVAALPQGYDTPVGERGHRFSGGERQRLSLARMLLRDAPVVVLDEATSALDTRTEAAVRETITGRAAGRTAVVIAHRLTTVRTADRIVVLDRGRIVESGAHDELLAAGGTYARLVTAGDTGAPDPP